MPQWKARSSSLTILSLNFFLLFFVLLGLRKRNSNNMKIIRSNLHVILPFTVLTFSWALSQLSKMSSAPYPYAQLHGCWVDRWRWPWGKCHWAPMALQQTESAAFWDEKLLESSLFKEVLGSVCQLTFSLTLSRFGKIEKYNLKYLHLIFFNLKEYDGAGKSKQSCWEK